MAYRSLVSNRISAQEIRYLGLVHAGSPPLDTATWTWSMVQSWTSGWLLDNNFIIQCWIIITLALMGWRHVHATVVAGFHPVLVPGRGHKERGLCRWFPQLFRRGGFLVRSSSVDLQTIFSFETRLTMVTREGFQLLHRLLVGLQTRSEDEARPTNWSAPIPDSTDWDFDTYPGSESK